MPRPLRAPPRATPRATPLALLRAAVPQRVPRVMPAALIALGALAACGDRELRGNVHDLPDPGLAFVAPYAARGACQLVGETDVTRPFLEGGTDLVACRSGTPGAFELVSAQGARQIGRTSRYTLYSVPRRSAE